MSIGNLSRFTKEPNFPIQLIRLEVKLPSSYQPGEDDGGNSPSEQSVKASSSLQASNDHNQGPLLDSNSDISTLNGFPYWSCSVQVGFYKFKQLASVTDSGQGFNKALENKKEELNEDGAFACFINKKYAANTVSKPGMFLEYLLPMITFYESCSEDQYKKIDEFLMPIWHFNNLTAKHILTKDDLSQYVECILKNIVNDELIDELAGKYCEKNNLNDTNKIKEKYRRNIADMRHVFLMTYNGFKRTENTDKDFPCSIDESYDETRLNHSTRLFLDFFRGCIEEKSKDLEPKELLNYRTNSGGCKLMVQSVANILGLFDSNVLIDELVFISGGDDKDKYKEGLIQLLQLQGEANVIFNDAISLFKEVLENECSIKDLPYDNKKAAIDWLKGEIQKYHDKISEFTRCMTIFLDGLNSNVTKDSSFKNVERYLKLISSGLSGVPLWSCFFTGRYYLIEPKEINLNIIECVTELLH